MELGRRTFLRWASALSGAAAASPLWACSADGGSGGPDAGEAPDGTVGPDLDGGTCRATSDDVLGPFFEPGAPMRTQIAAPGEPGERLTIEGQVLADDCTTPVAGALLDIWQADRDGAYHDAVREYRLRGQVLTDAEGRFRVESIRPGSYELGPGSMRPAHVHFLISKPGFATITTQLYFAGDPFLPPNDGCTGCGSDDPARIIALAGDADSGWTGQFPVVMRRG